RLGGGVRRGGGRGRDDEGKGALAGAFGGERGHPARGPVRRMGLERGRGTGRARGLHLRRSFGGTPIVVALVQQPVVVVVGDVATLVAQLAERLRVQVFATTHHVETVLRVHGREVHLPEERSFVAGAAQRVGHGPRPFAQREAVVLRREAMRVD